MYKIYSMYKRVRVIQKKDADIFYFVCVNMGWKSHPGNWVAVLSSLMKSCFVFGESEEVRKTDFEV